MRMNKLLLYRFPAPRQRESNQAKNGGNMKKAITIVLSAMMLGLCLTGCGGNDKNKIRLNEVTHSIFYAPQYLAMEMGYFEEEGLEIELTNGGGADKSMAALLSNGADIGLMGPEAAI